LDTIELSDTIIVPSQIIAVVNSTDYWMGMMGLGVTETNFTSVAELPFLSSLVQNVSLIPSHSYGFTAGAHYRKFPESKPTPETLPFIRRFFVNWASALA
jgi:hypothetical protein